MNQKASLSYPYPSILGSYGGSQSWFADKVMRAGGCGVVAAGDLLLYLSMHRKACRNEEAHSIIQGDGSISKPRYGQYLKRLRRHYFPLLPRFGMPYWVLTVGLNRFFIKYDIPLRARWGVWPWKLLRSMEKMLSDELPVILAVGPNFPWFLRKEKLTFYNRKEDGSFAAAARTSAHYVVVTAVEDGNIRISSWGREYWIKWEEYKQYAGKNSNYLMSNICYICERK